jgi:hypothetical protein
MARYGCDGLGTPRPDLDGSGYVGGFDLAILLGQWTGVATYSPCPLHIGADLDLDCQVDGIDLALLLAAWD